MKEKEEFLEYLKYQKNYSEHTIISYGKDIDEYLEFLDENHIDLYKITYDEIRKYLISLNDKDDINSTISRKISALRGLYKYLENN